MALLPTLKVVYVVIAQAIATQRLDCFACQRFTNVQNVRASTKCWCLVQKCFHKKWGFTHGPEAAMVVSPRTVDHHQCFCTGFQNIHNGLLDLRMAVLIFLSDLWEISSLLTYSLPLMPSRHGVPTIMLGSMKSLTF